MLKIKYFSLIELVIAITILATMAAVATPLYLKHLKTAKITAAKTQIQMLDQALIDYKLDVGEYPDSSSGLQALVENLSQSEKWAGPYLRPAVVPKDPWNREYLYTCPGEHGDFDLESYGADGQPGGTGENADFNNWE